MVNPVSNVPQKPNITPIHGINQQNAAQQQQKPLDQTKPLMPNQQMPDIVNQQPSNPNSAAQASQDVSKQVEESKQKEERKISVDKKVEEKVLQGIQNKVEEKEIVKNMKKTIEDETKRVTRKVNRSALKYILKNTDWIDKDKANEAEEFLTIKVPKVLSEELTHILSDVLGLEQVEES